MRVQLQSFRAPLISAIPGLLMMVAAIVGVAPSLGDLDGYFQPLRQRTAEVISGEKDPFWNPDSGCGEPFFSNPQSVLLYPPGWLATLVEPHRAIGIEAGFHLALLAAGCTLLALRLGAREVAAVGAGWGVALSGPIADSIGVLNNLETLAWIPWLWWVVMKADEAEAGYRPSFRWVLLTAFVFAAAVLGAEPQLSMIAALVALVMAPTRRTLIGLALGIGLVAVQIVPFFIWVLGGDRGPQLIGGAPSGTVELKELFGFVFSSFELPQRADRFLNHLHVPLWSGVLIVFAAIKGRRTLKKLAWCALVFALLALVPSMPAGREIWAMLTQGMVRFPARLIFLALVAGVPVAAALVGELQVPRQILLPLCTLLVAGSIFLPFSSAGALIGLVAAGWVIGGAKPAVAALMGSLALVLPQFDALELSKDRGNPPVLCAQAQRGARIYTLEPSWDQFAWVGNDSRTDRGRALGFGYTPLEDGRSTARTFGPLKSSALAGHLREADRGPSGRWWLDALAAGRIVAHHEVNGFPEICREGGLIVYDNPRAWPGASVFETLPEPDVDPVKHGRVVEQVMGDDRGWVVEVDEGGGVFVLSETPDPGWSYRLDGLPVDIIRGPGILQSIPVPEGDHRIDARMRPAGLVVGALISALSIMVVFVVFVRTRR